MIFSESGVANQKKCGNIDIYQNRIEEILLEGFLVKYDIYE